MSDKMKETIVKLRAACDAATDGPWEDGAVWDSKHETTTQCVNTDAADPDDSEEICLSGDLGNWVKESENMNFIAISRTALPKLLDAVEAIYALPGWSTLTGDGRRIDKKQVDDIITDALAGMEDGNE